MAKAILFRIPRSALNNEPKPDEKIYVFYHQVKGSTEKLYHLDSCCAFSPEIGRAKTYVKNPEELERQFQVIRGNFEYALEDPKYKNHACWQGKGKDEIETFYEELILKDE